MNNSLPGSESPNKAGETRKRRVLKTNKACVPCRARKVKCDAAIVGLPCSGCTSRQCAEGCVLPARKGRTRPIVHDLPSSSQPKQQAKPQSKQSSDSPDCQSPRQPEPDLLYLNILNDAVNETTESNSRHNTSNSPYRSRPEESLTPRNCLRTKLPRLDDIDNEYLVKKGVFDLPPPHYLDIFIKAYFDHVFPFVPVVNRADFIRGYQSGNCSLFLLRVLITPACLHVPADVISACGFPSASAAQESFFSKAKLLHDLSVEENSLIELQGSIILCLVILDHPIDRDFGYWFHNAIRLATSSIYAMYAFNETKSNTVMKLYRRIWWALYFMDIFHVFANTKRDRLLQDTLSIKPMTEDDWEPEDTSGPLYNFLSPLTPQQKPPWLLIASCLEYCLSIVMSKQHQDPRQILKPLDAWRKSLGTKMHVGDRTGTDVHYLNIQATSYRFECILCRLMRRDQSSQAEWSEWARQRLRSTMLELETIAMRVLVTNNAFQNFPVSFVTTMTALLALQIESALDPAETELVRSMARISINHTMLVLKQGQEIPALKRALPVFEDILAKRNLYLVTPNMSSYNQGNGQVVAPAQPRAQDTSAITADAYTTSAHPTSAEPVLNQQLDPSTDNNLSASFYSGDFLGFDFLDEWQIGQLDFTGPS